MIMTNSWMLQSESPHTFLGFPSRKPTDSHSKDPRNIFYGADRGERKNSKGNPLLSFSIIKAYLISGMKYFSIEQYGNFISPGERDVLSTTLSSSTCISPEGGEEKLTGTERKEMSWKLGTGEVGGSCMPWGGTETLMKATPWDRGPLNDWGVFPPRHPTTTPANLWDNRIIAEKAVGRRLPLRSNPKRRLKAKGGNKNSEARGLWTLYSLWLQQTLNTAQLIARLI